MSEQKKPKLTGKQERFAQLVASGKTQADAYREAYDGNDEPRDGLYQNASTLAADTHVALRISRLTQRYAAVAEIDAGYVLERVKATAEAAEHAEEHSPALKGYALLGKHVGLFQDRTEIEVRVKHELVGATYDDLRAMWESLESERIALQASAEVVEDEGDGP